LWGVTKVTSEKYAHFPIRSLQLFALRRSILFCTYSTWTKYIGLFGWLRPRRKKHKKCTRIGIRAKHPNEIWHIDVSHFIFPNGQKAFIQVVIDNFSRYVLAWQVLTSYDGATTAALLEQALKRTSRTKLRLLVDGGSENKGPGVQELEAEGAFTWIGFSNAISRVGLNQTGDSRVCVNDSAEFLRV